MFLLSSATRFTQEPKGEVAGELLRFWSCLFVEPWVLMIWVWQRPYWMGPGTLSPDFRGRCNICSKSGSIGSSPEKFKSWVLEELKFTASKQPLSRFATINFQLVFSTKSTLFSRNQWRCGVERQVGGVGHSPTHGNYTTSPFTAQVNTAKTV